MRSVRKINRKEVKTFLKAQVSAFSGGITDYGIMIFLTEIVHIHFTISILISGTIGGIVNFYINRLWAFKNQVGYVVSPPNQFIRFFSVVIISITLKSSGTYILHRLVNIDYRIGRVIIDLLVSYGFNYPMMRYWVFKNLSSSNEKKEKIELNQLKYQMDEE
ncbi:GtrA family protein [Pedobacter sp.]|uniref:GtrA family protein n=1 Tax=Pedobacter sp. TaxID=1411316 RepID=UPI003BAAC40E